MHQNIIYVHDHSFVTCKHLSHSLLEMFWSTVDSEQ